jgi:hypothetical protein
MTGYFIHLPVYSLPVLWRELRPGKAHSGEGIEEEKAVGDMNSNLILGGFLLMLICQDIVAIKAIKKNMQEGILCAMIPGYILYYANREGASQFSKPLIGWLAGAGLMLMGVLR